MDGLTKNKLVKARQEEKRGGVGSSIVPKMEFCLKSVQSR